MPVINSMPNPMDPKKPINFAKGRIKFISIKPHVAGAKDVDENGLKTTWIRVKGQQDKKVESTHKASLLLQEVDDNNVVIPDSEEWIGLGDQKLHPNHADKLQIKEGDEFVTLLQGMVVTIPLKIDVKGDKTFVNGNKSKMVIVDRENAVALAPKGASSAPAASGGLTKVFGTIVAISGNEVQVETSDDGIKTVILTGEQVSQIVEGGRLSAMVDNSGTAKSGFKPYGIAVRNAGAKKDDTGAKAGNALNIVALMQGYPDVDDEALFVTAEAIYLALEPVRERLGKEFTSLDAYTLGVTLGLAAKLVAPRFNANSGDLNAFTTATEEMFRGMVTFEDKLRPKQPEAKPEAPAKAPAAKAATKPAKAAVAASAPVMENPPVQDYAMDFDDDIPF